jgi:hypothetical protein
MPSEARRSSKSETHDLSATEHLFARRTPSSRPLFVGYCCRSRCVVSSPLCLANINITKGATCASARGPSRLLGSMRIVETIRPIIRRGLDRRIAVTAGDCTIPFVICPKSGCLHGGRSAASSSFVLESGDGQSNPCSVIFPATSTFYLKISFKCLLSHLCDVTLTRFLAAITKAAE